MTLESQTVTAVLTEGNIAVETNVEYENSIDVQFTVVKEPVHGVVEVAGDDGRTRLSCRRFSLADVQHGVVTYRRNASVESGIDRDHFVVVLRLDDLQTTTTLDVDLTPPPPVSTRPPPTTPDATATTDDEVDDVEPTTEELNVTTMQSAVISLVASNLTIIEGQSAFVDDTTLLLGDRHRRHDVIFTVVTQPSHGRIEAADRPGVRLTQFSGDQLASSALRYVHSGDEAPRDNFTVSARLRSRPDVHSPPVTVHVDVVGVNDQPPTVVVNARLKLWTGI